jgi:hypothetical protein
MPYKDPAKRLEVEREARKRLLEKNPNYHKEWVAKNPPTLDNLLEQRYKQVTKLYGLTKEAYLNMIRSQDNKCAICKRKETTLNKRGLVRPLCVDHCHVSGKVRALLCNHCNSMLGHARDNKELLLSAVSYLTTHTEEN